MSKRPNWPMVVVVVGEIAVVTVVAVVAAESETVHPLATTSRSTAAMIDVKRFMIVSLFVLGSEGYEHVGVSNPK